MLSNREVPPCVEAKLQQTCFSMTRLNSSRCQFSPSNILSFHERFWNEDLGSFVEIQEEVTPLKVVKVLVYDTRLATNEEEC